MATSVVALDFTDIFEEAFDDAGVEMRTAYDLRTARRGLTLLMQEWANRGLNLWTVDEATQACTIGTASYTLAETDTVDLIDQVIQMTDGVTEYPLTRVSVATYSKYSKKTQSGRPSTIYVQRLKSSTVITLWPVPDKAYTVKYWRLRGLESFSSGIAENPDMPARFIPALTAGLAVKIATKRNPEKLAVLKPFYDEQWRLAYEEDRDRASLFVVPGGYS